MDAIAAIHGRRSIRAYQARSVERDLVEAIIWDAAQAPSTPVSGAQPWAFNIIQGAERIADYSARAKRFAKEHRPDEAGYGWADKRTSRFSSTRPRSSSSRAAPTIPKRRPSAAAPART